MLQAPPALLVAQLAAVEESIANEIADKPSPETRRSYEHVWRFYRAWLAAQPLEATAVRPKHIQAYIASLRLKGQKKGTIGRALSAIRTLYGRLVCDELMLTNPAREVKGPKVDSNPKAPWIRDDADIAKLINVPAETWTERRDRLIVRLTFGLGVINGAIVYRVVRQKCALAGIDVVPPHALRRTFITHGGERGVDMNKLQGAVGHASVTTTERYNKANNAARNKTGNVFADLVRA